MSEVGFLTVRRYSNFSPAPMTFFPFPDFSGFDQTTPFDSVARFNTQTSGFQIENHAVKRALDRYMRAAEVQSNL